MSHFEVYGQLARQEKDQTRINGRFDSQKQAESLIAADIISKLKITKNDRVLDIGCGAGVNIPLMASIASYVTGCDHPDVVKVARKKNPQENVEFIGGNFLDLEFKEKFNKILLYGVVSTLPDKKILENFFDKALNFLTNDGCFLIGDIPNQDKKRRFLNSKRGQAFQKEWEKKSDCCDYMALFDKAGDAVQFDDLFILELLSTFRQKGFHAYLLDQPQNLPFGNSREDILIVGAEYDIEK